MSTTKEYYTYSPLVKGLGEAERKGSGGEEMQTYIICNSISVILIAIVQIMHSFDLKRLWKQQQELLQQLGELKK